MILLSATATAVKMNLTARAAPSAALAHDERQLDPRGNQRQPFNCTSRIGMLAPNDKRAVESAYLAVLTRRPTPEEATHFEAFLADDSPASRTQRLEDLYWTLLNSTEFSWNH